MDDTELIWAAGLFAGEGCATVEKGDSKKRNNYPVLSIGMNDEGSVRRFAAALTPHMPPRTSYLKHPAVNVTHDKAGQFRCHMGGTRALAAFKLLLPHLVGTDKEKQINTVVALAAKEG